MVSELEVYSFPRLTFGADRSLIRFAHQFYVGHRGINLESVPEVFYTRSKTPAYPLENITRLSWRTGCRRLLR